jgi:hypothetical protein
MSESFDEPESFDPIADQPCPRYTAGGFMQTVEPDWKRWTDTEAKEE